MKAKLSVLAICLFAASCGDDNSCNSYEVAVPRSLVRETNTATNTVTASSQSNTSKDDYSLGQGSGCSSSKTTCTENLIDGTCDTN